jgi:multidrug/hemolysin transport system ATP-binding protein
MNAVVVENLVKKYGSLVAVANISFEVEQGSVFAFLGTNGAGKSTTIGCITTITGLTSGKILVNGNLVNHDNDAIRNQIGVVFQNSLLDPLLSVRENLESRAAFYRLGKTSHDRISDLAKRIDLESFLDRRYGLLSDGQKRRVDVARALIHKPSILFLDEPTAGLDPQSREKVWQTIYELQSITKLTVFLTTHYMEETERANMVYVIDKGKIVAHGTPQTLRATFSKNQLHLVGVNQSELLSNLHKENISFTLKEEGVVIDVKSGKEAIQILKKYEPNIKDFEFQHGNMDEVFLELTGEIHRRMEES